MKRVEMFSTIESFSECVNRNDISIISIDVKVVEQSINFQQGFCGIVYYDEYNEISEISISDAENLALMTDYYCFSVGDTINTADAGAFFLEGYNHALSLINSK